jgi:hypothetical protein
MLIIGKCIAGNGRLSDGTTLAEKYPKRYQNVLADYIDLVIAQAKADQALNQRDALCAETERREREQWRR